MSATNRVHWDGPAAVLAGLLYALGVPGSNEILPGVSHVAGHILFAGAGLFSLVALQGFAARDTACSVRLGLTGFWVASISALSILGGNSAEAIWEHQFEITSTVTMLGMLGAIVGVALIGVASRRTRALPGWSALALIIAPVIFLLIFVGGMAVFMSGDNLPPAAVGNAPLTALLYVLAVLSAVPWLALGYGLWSGVGEAPRHRSAGVGGL